MSKKLKIEEIYKKLDEVEHVLLRPGMYVGSTKIQTTNEYVYNIDKNIITKQQITYIPAFLKIFDEIITNSVDESKRNKNLNTIKVTIDKKENTISIWDNGGIPVLKHKEHNQYVPELIFSQLRSGSNFNDDDERLVAGTHGYGSTLTNIFSELFIVKTADGKNQFTQTFTNNMSNKSAIKINKSNKNFTEIKYKPDFKYFKISNIDDNHFNLIQKRVVDIAACNNELKVYLNNKRINIKNFKNYADLYTIDDDSTQPELIESYYESSNNWDIAIGQSTNGYKEVSFVNSTETKDGGTHTNYIINQIVNKLREFIKKKYKYDIKPSEIKNHLILFVNVSLVNPSFASQTKEKLITEQKDFNSLHEVSDKLIKNIFNSEILKSILDWIDKKKQAEINANIRKLNKNISNIKILKLIDASEKYNRDKCSLGLFEGDSSVSAVRKFRDAKTFGAFPLRGKFLNINNMKITDIIKNEEVKNVMAAIGLKIGENAFEYEQDSKNKITLNLLDCKFDIDLNNEILIDDKWVELIKLKNKNLKVNKQDLQYRKIIKRSTLRYNRILFYVDADQDGQSISALLINFFYTFWPELFLYDRVFKVETPLLTATSGKTTNLFYNNHEFDKWEKSVQINRWSIEYKKGLAALTDSEYKEIINNPKLLKITKDNKAKESLDVWFGNDSDLRKEKLLKL